MSDLTAWLARLGLEKYAPLFAENDVDLEILKALSETDLRELGLPLGARKRILQAHAEAPDRASPAAASPDRGAEPSSRPGPERRQITVMFSDVVGSTALAEQVDVEDLRSLVLTYQQACAAAISRYDGHIAQYLGDGVLAYFGYPQAHEDDAVRAVHTGLSIVDSMREINRRLVTEHGVALDIRVGVHTGLVVAGEMGAGATRERLAIGETPNVAARVQGLADPGTVIVSDATWRLVEGFFTGEPLGPQVLKGLRRPIVVHRILGSTGLSNPFEARLTRTLTPLVSRQVELSLLAKRWEQATEGEGQVVLVQGEPGIGKSRLVRVFRGGLAETEHQVMTFHCSSQHQSSAFYPVVEQMVRALELTPDDGDPERRAKLRGLMERFGVSVDAFTPLAALLGIAGEEDAPALPTNPDQRRRVTFDALVEMVTAPARGRATLLLIEDVHWIDPSTQELIASLVDAVQERRVMIVLTARPEYRAPWTGLGHFSLLTVGRLSRRETEAMIRQVAGRSLSADVLSQLLARSDGVPLFVEELTKSVLDTDSAAGAQINAVPETLQDALTARLDRLAPVRELIQVAALLGRVFDVEIVRAVTGLGADQLDRALVDLADAGLVYRRPRQDHRTFEFKHALIQEAALNTLVRRQRALLHARIAEVLPRIRAEIVQRQPEVVAYHLQEAGDDRAALGLWCAAGELAAQRSASAEAAEHFARAAECSRRLGSGAVAAEDEAAIHLSLATALMQAEGYRSDRLARAVQAADAAARATGSLSLQCRVAVQTAPIFYATGRNEAYLSAVEHLAQRASTQVDPSLHATLLVARGTAHFNRGEYIEAERNFQVARDLLSDVTGASRTVIGGGDGAVVAGAYASMALRELGRLEEAYAVAFSTERRGRALDDPFSLAWALVSRCRGHTVLGKYEMAIVDAEEAIAISRRHGFSRLGVGLLLRGTARARLGELEQGIEDCREALALWRRPGVVFATPSMGVALADLLLRAGRPAEARTILDDMDALVSGTDEVAVLAECQRLRALVAIADSDPSGAEHWLEAAVTTARSQAALLFELRATTALAEVLAAQRREVEARHRLADVLGRFTQGHEAPDLKAARALLDRLQT